MTESELLVNVANLYIIKVLKEEFIKQGHELTEEWEDSIIVQAAGESAAEVLALGYGMIVDAGIEPERIPFGGEGTGGGVSQYILGLQRFWKLRKPGISDKAALKLAFATANVQKEEGMSTEASKVFSQTGERQHFMQSLIDILNYQEFDSEEGGFDDIVFTGLEVIINEQAASPQRMYL